MIAVLRGGPNDGELREVEGEPEVVPVYLPPLAWMTGFLPESGDLPKLPLRVGYYRRDMLCTDRTAGRFVWAGERV